MSPDDHEEDCAPLLLRSTPGGDASASKDAERWPCRRLQPAASGAEAVALAIIHLTGNLAA